VISHNYTNSYQLFGERCRFFMYVKATNKLLTALITSHPSKGRRADIKEKEQQGQKECEVAECCVTDTHVVRVVYSQAALYD